LKKWRNKEDYLVFIGVFNFLGRMLVLTKALFHSYFPFLNFLNQMIHFYRSIWVNLTKTCFRSLHTFSSIVPCEATFYPFTPDFMKWLYSKVHMLPVKEKCNVYFLMLNCVCSWNQIACFLCIIYNLWYIYFPSSNIPNPKILC
jgi:hypothetical protein